MVSSVYSLQVSVLLWWKFISIDPNKFSVGLNRLYTNPIAVGFDTSNYAVFFVLYFPTLVTQRVTEENTQEVR